MWATEVETGHGMQVAKYYRISTQIALSKHLLCSCAIQCDTCSVCETLMIPRDTL